MSAKEIAERLMKDISEGIYSNDGKLPGESKLAEAFGVSRMTLRAALEELRRHGLIEKRNGTGSFLTKRAYRKSGIIGLIIPDYESFAFFTSINKEITRHASKLKYTVKLVTTKLSGHREIVLDMRRKVRELAVSRVEGVVFRPFVDEGFAAVNREIVDILRHAEIPFVLIDSDITSPPDRSDCDLVAVNNIGAGRQIAKHLFARGFRRIAFLMRDSRPFASANWSNRLFGLAGELALLGCAESVRRLDFPPSAETAVGKLMRRRDKPDAIVCGNDEQARILIGTLLKAGRRIPEDVAVVGFDNTDIAYSLTPPLTTVSQPVRKLAVTAVKTLLARIRFPNNDPHEILLDAPLVIRSSTDSRQ